MNLIDKISSSAIQKFFLTGNKNQRIEMTLRYMPSQEAWFADFLYLEKQINGVRVVSGINILRKYRNTIPFGIGCDSVSGLDPYYPDDFANGNASLFLLSADDVALYETEFFQ